jgi:hypothetical protein
VRGLLLTFTCERQNEIPKKAKGLHMLLRFPVLGMQDLRYRLLGILQGIHSILRQGLL